MVEASTGVVCIYRKADGGSRRHGAAGSQWWPRDGERAQVVEMSCTMAVSMAGLTRVMLWIILKIKMRQRKTAARRLL